MEEDIIMTEKEPILINECDFRDVNPIMTALPYPSIRVKEQNVNYANLLSIDYCGSVSELSAITQYINNQNRLSFEKCPVAKTILGIAIAEMIHLQKLGQLISLLGGSIDFTAKYREGGVKMWTPQYLTLAEHAKKMIMVSIESEKSAINQYRMHMNMIKDQYVNAVLARIIQDEEYHIMVLKALITEEERQ